MWLGVDERSFEIAVAGAVIRTQLGCIKGWLQISEGTNNSWGLYQPQEMKFVPFFKYLLMSKRVLLRHPSPLAWERRMWFSLVGFPCAPGCFQPWEVSHSPLGAQRGEAGSSGAALGPTSSCLRGVARGACRSNPPFCSGTQAGCLLCSALERTPPPGTKRVPSAES